MAENFLNQLAAKNTSAALLWLNKAREKGIELKVLIQEVLQKLRRIMLAKYGVGKAEIDDYGLETNEIMVLISLFDRAARELRGALFNQLPLELAIIEWGQRQAKPKAIGKKKKARRPVKEFLKKWPAVLQKVKMFNHSTEALLKAAQPIKLEKGKLIIEVFYSFHKEKLESKECLKIVEKSLKEVFQQLIKIKYILKGEKNVH